MRHFPIIVEGIIDKMTKISPLNSRFTLPFVFVLIVSLLFMLPVGFLQAQTSDDKIEYAENGTGPVAVFTATDPENAGDITWSLLTINTDDDKDDFTMDGGVLSFKKSPNFEKPTGGGEDGTSTTYTVTVVATDADFQTTQKEVMIEVTNLEEAGTVSLTSTMNVTIDITLTTVDVMALTPHPGVRITATLTDEDGRDRNHDWQWSRSSSRNGSYSNIVDADATTYTPTANDVGYFLRATVSYRDGEGTGKSAMATSMHPVQAIRSPNAAPEFPDQDSTTPGIQNDAATRMVIENAESRCERGRRSQSRRRQRRHLDPHAAWHKRDGLQDRPGYRADHGCRRYYHQLRS